MRFSCFFIGPERQRNPCLQSRSRSAECSPAENVLRLDLELLRTREFAEKQSPRFRMGKVFFIEGILDQFDDSKWMAFIVVTALQLFGCLYALTLFYNITSVL